MPMPDIKQSFTTGGKAQRQSPDRNEALKQEVVERLNRLPELSGPTAKSKLPWLSFALAGLAVITLIFQPSLQSSQSPIVSTRSYESGALSETSIARDYYPMPPYNESIPVSDRREFLKTTYHAQIQTRQVDETALLSQRLIRQFDGRIDSLTISEQSGYISFALPSENLGAFQTEVSEMVPDKFITETINAQNLLPQQKKIESQDPKDKEAERKLAENVETVQGSIALEHITSWESLTLYAGPYWIPLILAVLAVFAYGYHRYLTTPFPEIKG